MEPVWIFGYGSLIWRPGFPVAVGIPGRARGWVRRFYQGSPDHRGTPNKPGRVVTLLPESGGITHGTLWKIQAGYELQTLADLEIREKAGYQRHRIEVETEGGRVNALTWIAPHDDPKSNPNYLGPAPLADMVAQIRSCHGPSGANLDYLIELGRVLDEMHVSDSHVQTLLRAVRSKESELS